ncbi:MAG TPA: pitrilysin family protein [Armatimonadota bacterium]|nr:pitrilysin family protein [Armatimonadota bacterium]
MTARQRSPQLTALVTISLCLLTSLVAAQPIVDHPSQLVFPELRFDPPSAEQFRVELRDGLVVYIQEDHTLPTFQLSLSWIGGSYFDPPGKEGLAGLTYALLRSGGTTRMTADQVDERLEFLSAQIGTSAGLYEGTASCWCLSRDTDEVLGLLADILLRPAFEEDKIRREREEALETLSHRYDSPASLLGARLPKLLYGDAPPGRTVTGASVMGITRDDLIAFHKNFVGANKAILTVSGDFAREEMLDKLSDALAEFVPTGATMPDRDERLELPGAATPATYLLNKAGPQAQGQMCHLGIERHDPDFVPLRVLNYVLGGGGLSDRLARRVRGDEGLTYAISSTVEAPYGRRGAVGVSFSCGANNAAYVVSLVREEIDRIRAEEVTDEELTIAKDAFLGTFPDAFSTPYDVIANLAALERAEVPLDFYSRVRDEIAAVTRADLLRVAREHWRPDALLIVLAGDAAAMQAGNPEKPATFGDAARVHVIEPKDPVACE